MNVFFLSALACFACGVAYPCVQRIGLELVPNVDFFENALMPTVLEHVVLALDTLMYIFGTTRALCGVEACVCNSVQHN